MFSVHAPSEGDLQSLLARARKQRFSYPEVEASRTTMPNMYLRRQSRIRLGSGAIAFSRAIEALHSWQMVRIAGVRIYPTNPPIEPGNDVVLMIRCFGIWSLNLCRVVYVSDIDEPSTRRFSFAYGTLPEHVIRGEERFTVERDIRTDAVYYEILSFSRPATAMARAGYPIVRMLQDRFTRKSLSGMRRATETDLR
jgi:uncharacterized protein (UPF0548 family)